MVVLWKTQAGLSRPWGADSEHWKEYVSITSDDDYAWVGSYAKWTGRPLLAEYNPEPKAAAPLTGRLWINITNPITIGYLEEIDSQMGALQGDSYDRLMCALDHTERQLKEAAYVEWNEHHEPGNTEVWPGKPDDEEDSVQKRATRMYNREWVFVDGVEETSGWKWIKRVDPSNVPI
ncbi:hypothetical protein E4T42_00872 [Aureobasidium subglaciale]|nr:hypothetical protein E4T42_00872 [Aureobasidium subglaciale]